MKLIVYDITTYISDVFHTLVYFTHCRSCFVLRVAMKYVLALVLKLVAMYNVF